VQTAVFLRALKVRCIQQKKGEKWRNGEMATNLGVLPNPGQKNDLSFG